MEGMQRTELYDYFDLVRAMIESEEYLQSSKSNPEDFTRKRKMPFPQLMWFMLTRTKGSTQNALERFCDQTGEETSMTQQAFSTARMKIKDSAFSELFYTTARLPYTGYYETWRGYRVSAIDGSKLALPDIDLLGSIYGTMGSDSSSPTAQASIHYDVLNKVIMDALVEPLSVDERNLACQHIKNLEKNVRLEKELIIMDRGYPSYEMIHSLSDENISYIMRVKRAFNAYVDAQTDALGSVTLHKRGFPDMHVRVVKFELPSGETEMLLTDLWQDDLTVDDFKELYFLRWPVETKFDEVKNKLEIENFTGQSVRAIRQDFYVTMYLSNLAAVAWWEAQEHVKRERDGKANKYQYAVNVNHEIGVLKDRLIYAFILPTPDLVYCEVERIIRLLARRVCPIKPNRSPARNKYPRKVKFHSNARSNC
jgi:hypothetical protein